MVQIVAGRDAGSTTWGAGMPAVRLGRKGFGMTVSQVVHAASDGFMYAALRLMTGSLWPVMLLHGL